MLLSSKLTILLALSCVCALCPLTSRAQSFSPTDEREIRNFKLTDDYLNRYKAVLDEAKDSNSGLGAINGQSNGRGGFFVE